MNWQKNVLWLLIFVFGASSLLRAKLLCFWCFDVLSKRLLKDSEAKLRCFLPSGKHVEDWGFIVAKLYYRFWFVRCLCFLTSNVFAEKTKKEDSGSVVKSEAKPDRPGNLCCYSQRVCNLEKLKGFDFCHKHILEDKASPFKPCDFVAKSNGRRCPNPAPKLPDRGKR